MAISVSSDLVNYFECFIRANFLLLMSSKFSSSTSITIQKTRNSSSFPVTQANETEESSTLLSRLIPLVGVVEFLSLKLIRLVRTKYVILPLEVQGLSLLYKNCLFLYSTLNSCRFFYY